MHPGPTLRRRRRELGLTLKQVGAIAGLDIGALSRIERAVVSPRESTLRAVATALGLDAASLPRQEKPMSATAEVGLLTLDAAADELGVASLAVQRLVARGQLRATRLGQKPDAPWRIDAAALRSYIISGAPDFDCPALQGGWFDDPDRLGDHAHAFCKAIGEAARRDGQIPDRDDGPPKGAVPEKPIALRMTASVQRVANAKPPEALARYGDRRTAYLVAQVRLAAKAVIRFDGRTPAIAKLYHSPARYQEIVAEAGRQLLAGVMPAGCELYMVSGSAPGSAWRSFHFQLRHALLATGSRMSKVVSLAF